MSCAVSRNLRSKPLSHLKLKSQRRLPSCNHLPYSLTPFVTSPSLPLTGFRSKPMLVGQEPENPCSES